MIDLIWKLAGVYGICGLLFAIAFITKGVSIVDEGAEGSSVGFRIIILPGTVVLWPLLLRKWIKSAKNKHHD